MINLRNKLQQKYTRQDSGTHKRTLLQVLHIDLYLLLGLVLLTCVGFMILYSADNQHLGLVKNQAFHLLFAFIVMFGFAQITPQVYQRWAPAAYFTFVFLLLLVLIIGSISKGAKRWLDLGFFNFQPSELLKIAIPLFLASRYANTHLPINFKKFLLGSVIILVPALLTAKQPDLGSAILLAIAGFSVLFLAGVNIRIILTLTLLGIIATPFLWHFMHAYQQERILTFLNPERDPLGAGYHIIQSKIAIGSGGLFGKGWLQSTQANLHFLPENRTDFIFGVFSEEFGFVGCVSLILIYLLIIARGMFIAAQAQTTFTRLLAGSLTLTFFFSFFINMGMVTGIMPVVGLPLPLISYGGTSMVTMLANFGILMSISNNATMHKG